MQASVSSFAQGDARDLTERRATDRCQIVECIRTAVAPSGSVEAEWRTDGVDVVVSIHRGLLAIFSLERYTPQALPDTFVVAWVVPPTSSLSLSDRASALFDVNPHHRRKATSVVHGVPALLDLFVRVVDAERNGQLYAPAPGAHPFHSLEPLWTFSKNPSKT